MAPEMLMNDPKCSTKVDVYSFGIIMYELFFETLPYAGEDHRSVIALGRSVVAGHRPSIPEGVYENVTENERSYLKIMKQCWQENVDVRPSFNDIYNWLDTIAL